MNNFIKSFLINLIIFLVIVLSMVLFGSNKESYILLFKIWIWFTAIIIGYFVILQIQNGKNKEDKKE